MEVDGDSLSYQDMMERQMNEEHRRQRERAIMEDGRAMWQQKKREQFELELKEQDEVRNGPSSFCSHWCICHSVWKPPKIVNISVKPIYISSTWNIFETNLSN